MSPADTVPENQFKTEASKSSDDIKGSTHSHGQAMEITNIGVPIGTLTQCSPPPQFSSAKPNKCDFMTENKVINFNECMLLAFLI